MSAPAIPAPADTTWPDLAVRIHAVVDGDLTELTHLTELTLAPTRNGAGPIQVTYPAGVPGYDLLRSRTDGANRDLEVEIWPTGSADGAWRGWLEELSGDPVAENGAWTFTGRFAEMRMDEAVVFPQPPTGEATLGPTVQVTRSSVTAARWTRFTTTLGYAPSTDADPSVSVPQKVRDAVLADAPSIPKLADPKRELVFSAATPGAMLHFLLAQARARGALIDFTTSFTATLDSAGQPWTSVTNTTISPGATYSAILGLLVRLGRAEWGVHWTGSAYCLDLWNDGNRGVDRSLDPNPVVVRAGRNIVESPQKWSVRGAPTAMLAAGAEGFYADASDAGAQARRGRRIEGSTSSQNLATADAVSMLAQRTLSVSSSGVLEITHGLSPEVGEPRPLAAFGICDWVLSDTGLGDLERLKVVEFSLTVNADNEIQPSSTVTLNDRMLTEAIRTRAQLDALADGSTVVGTSTPDQQADTTPPSPPTGLVISSGAFNQGIDAYAVVAVGWTAPVTNVDGTALTSLAAYRVEWTEAAQPTAWRTAATVDGGTTQAQFTCATGLPILVRVAAIKASGAQSTWLTLTAAHTTEIDSSPPPVPSALVGSSALGLISFTWDGKSVDGAPMFSAAPDFAWCELHISTSSNFTPDATTLVDKLFGAGTYSYAKLPDGTALAYDVTYYARLVSVDVRKNRQTTAGGQGSATPRKLLGPDIFDRAVGSAALAYLAVKAANIDVLQVNDGHMVSCSIGKLTAGILTASMLISTGSISTRQDGTTGAGCTTDSAGFRLYDLAGNVTMQAKSADGSFMAAGEYRTSLLSGLRIVFNPNGSSPDEIRFYPGNTNQYARMKTLSSRSTSYPNQAGISMKGYSPRSDSQSGESSVFPDFARLAFGNEVGGGTISSSITAEKHQASMAGARVQIGAQSGSGEAEDSTIRIGVLNNAGTAFVPNCTWKFNNSGTNGSGRILTEATNGNSGIQFNPADQGYHGISVVTENNSLVDVYARAFKTSSDRKLKKNIGGLPFDALAAVLGARARSYNLRTDPNDAPRTIGLLADELPEAARTRVQGPDGRERLGIDVYAALAVLWDAVAELAGAAA